MSALYKNCEEARTLSRKTQWIYSSQLYHAWTHLRDRLPSAARDHAFIAFDETLGYGSELVFAATNVIALLGQYQKDRKGFRRRVEVMLDDPAFHEFVEQFMPRLLGWYRFFAETYSLGTGRVHTVLVEYKKCQSVFTPTPIEAVRMFQARRTTSAPRPRSKSIRLQFYTDFQKGKYKLDQMDDPDAWIDLPVDRAKGVDLSVARKAWGLESLAIITNAAPLRLVFDPVDEDRLSPLALYDLSKNFTHPLRVFEPRVSTLTKVSRALRSTFYPAVLFMATFLPLILGFPAKDTTPMKVHLGQRYTEAYQSAGRVTNGVRLWAVEGARLLLMLLFSLCLLPFATLFVAFCSAKQIATWSLWRAATSARDAVLFTLSLEKQSWVIIFGLCWFGLAEYCASRL